ncbi:MAG: hypothetical protein RI973_2261 [Bacteroidota bacterium]|jgi:hypothetical protein
MKTLSYHIIRAFEPTAGDSHKGPSPKAKGIFKKRQWVFS